MASKVTRVPIAGDDMGYQTPRTRKPDRKDHIWFRKGDGAWKCLLCGAVAHDTPPDHPTSYHWLPEAYERLDEVERNLAPFSN